MGFFFFLFNSNTVLSNDTSKGKSLFLEEAYSNNSSGLKRFQFKALVKRKNVALNVEEEQKEANTPDVGQKIIPDRLQQPGKAN